MGCQGLIIWLIINPVTQTQWSSLHDSHEGTDTPEGSEDVQVVMSSFKSHVVKVRVAKKPGKQHMQLLADENEEGGGGLWNSITR